MRKWNIQIITRLNEKEHERFKKRVKKSGLPQETFVRFMLDGFYPVDAPPPDYFAVFAQ